MGGTMFYDFHLLHRFLGVRRMVSIERDPVMHPRSRFNCPFDFITVENETVANFLANDKDDSTTIYWLDYDGEIGPDIISDVISLGTKVRVGGFAFVTVYAQTPGFLLKVGGEGRLAYLQEYLGDFSAGLTLADMENSAFPTTVYSILMTAFRNAFATRTDGVFQPLFRVRYRAVTSLARGGSVPSAALADSLPR